MHQLTTLDNGLRIISATMPHTRSVSIGIFVAVGSRHEEDRVAGISHFIEHVCFKGTRDFPTAVEISDAIEGVGGLLNAGTDRELTVYWCKVPRTHYELAWHVLSDMVRHPSFEAAEIEKERNVIIEEINMSLDSPPQQADLQSDAMVWPGHPLGGDIAGTKETVAAINREDMLAFRAMHYRPQSVVVSLAGDISHDTAVAMVRATLEDWANGPALPAMLPASTAHGPALVMEHRDIEQANLVLALPGIAVTHPDRFAFDLLNVILGEGSLSRLFLEIRENLGLTYSIQSHLQYYLDSGALNISAGADPENLAQMLGAVLDELRKLRKGVSEAELDKAREICKGRLMLRLEDSRNVSGWLGSQEVLTGEVLTPEDIIARLDAVTTTEVNRMILEFIEPAATLVSVVGPVPDAAALRRLIGIK